VSQSDQISSLFYARRTYQEHDRITVFVQSLARWWIARLVVVFVLGTLGVIEPATAAGPWKGQVVDRENGKPLEGVVVPAAWYKADSTHGGWGGAGYYHFGRDGDGYQRALRFNQDKHGR
jgi:hypothetical protein